MAMLVTDFNDLHCQVGIAEVTKQINEAIKRFQSSPAPSDSAPELQNVLNRYALIHGESKYYDFESKQIIKKTAFIELVTKPVFNQWSSHPERRVIDKQSLANGSRDHGGDDARAQKMLDRYVYIYPTKDTWDSKRREMVPLEILKMALPDYFDWWLKHPNRKDVVKENLVFDPTQRCNPDTHINMFQGLPLTPSDSAGNCSLIVELLYSLCNFDLELVDWVTKWLAFPLQNVGAKLDSALIFHSDIQGTGKSLLFSDIVSQLYGQYSATVGQHQLESQYTDWRSNMLYAVFEEIFSRDQKYSHTGTVKHMVTGKTQRIEKKFISGWEEANHMNCVFLSNEIQPFPIERSDRRMCVIWPKTTLTKEDFAKIDAQAKSGGIESFYRYLLSYDLGDFDEHTKPPMNEAKKRLISFGLPSWEVFFDEWEGGHLRAPYVSCKTTSLFAVYREMCSEWNERPVSLQRFSGFIGSKLPVARCRYTQGLSKSHPATFIMVPPDPHADARPEDESKAEYLGWCQKTFEDALED